MEMGLDGGGADLLRAIENLGYKCTAGDLAAHLGISVDQAQQQLIELAIDSNGHIQVSLCGRTFLLHGTLWTRFDSNCLHATADKELSWGWGVIYVGLCLFKDLPLCSVAEASEASARTLSEYCPGLPV